MLQFAENWSWDLKALVVVGLVFPLPILLTFFGKQYGMRSEGFLLAWIVGASGAFIFLASISETMEMKELVNPLLPFLCVILFGAILGGVGNILLAQSIGEAPNPGLPWAIFTINTPLAYLLAYALGKIFPVMFPVFEFNWINFAGIIVLGIGLVMVMYRTNTITN